jgi:hypothetical protein
MEGKLPVRCPRCGNPNWRVPKKPKSKEIEHGYRSVTGKTPGKVRAEGQK